MVFGRIFQQAEPFTSLLWMSFMAYVICSCFVQIVDSTSNFTDTTTITQSTRRLALLGECQADCTKDGDCKSGLLCAAKHRSALKKLNVDPRKAYCTVKTGKYDDVCYNPKKLPSKPLLRECQTECTSDKQCMEGLECTKQHKYKLQKRDLFLTSAYCMTDAKNGTCYDPKRLPPIVTDPQCPSKLSDGCDSTQSSGCVSGKQFCCRKFKEKLANGQNLCSSTLRCQHLEFCNCSASNEWECTVYKRSLVPNCLAPYRCSN